MDFHAFIIDEAGETTELDSARRARLVRELYKATRIRDPQITPLAQSLQKRELELGNGLRVVTDAERTEGVRPAVWPVAAFVVV